MNRFRFPILIAALLVPSFGVPAEAGEPSAEAVRFFENEIRPLLSEHCWKCHGEKQSKGGIKLDSLAAMIHGGDSGTALVPGKPDESLLIEAVRYEGYEMPPAGKLPDKAIEALETWVRIGAPWPGIDPEKLRTGDAAGGDRFSDQDRQWWAVQTVTKNDPPESSSPWTRNPIDEFILAKLADQGLSPAPEADREDLVRRLTFDLTGLPPTPEEVERFINDDSYGAYEALVDRLLDSDAYGERFARRWLDVVRYADSDGYRADHGRPYAYRYRDYVIDAFNEDMPYDRFVMEQLAGDELFPGDPRAKIATGFLTHGIYEYNNRDVVGHWDIMLNEITDTIGDVFLGVGMQCSRCHDHKFDPLLQRDYFALRAFVEPILIERSAVCASSSELAAYEKAEAEWEAKTESIREKLDQLEAKYREQARDDAVTKFPPDIQEIMAKPAEQRTPRELQYAELIQLQIEFEYDRMDSKFSKEDKEKILALRRDLREFDDLKPKPLPRGQAVRDTGPIAPATVIPKKRSEVDPGYLAILSDTFDAEMSDAAMPSSTGRRSQLAKWIADDANPLSTRVIVNRVWQSHFGRGLAPNASDFGTLGGNPSHPELLDWLTATFVENGWRLKPLHRLIVTSATYRQSTTHPQSASYSQVDPKNTWYWRRDVRRLDAEQIRDSILVVSGSLNRSAGGAASSDDKHRRSIYTSVKRNARLPLLDAFDLPLFFNSTASRDTTTNPLQSLMLINSQAMLDHAEQLAGRVDAPNSRDSIDRLWRLAYGRAPEGAEGESADAFLSSQAGQYKAEEKVAQQKIETSTLPYRDGAAIVVKPDVESTLRTRRADAVKVDEFTIETIFQISSIYESGAVRSLASTWNGNRDTAGWTFGVTGKGSRRKPQTLVLHMFGSDGKTDVTEAAIFSDQHVELNKPYYAAASVKLAADGRPGEVKFLLKDISDDEQPISAVTMEHPLVGGVGSGAMLAIGGRISGNASVFDGLIDDVRLSAGQLADESLLLASDAAREDTVGFWRFEPSAGLGNDESQNGIDVSPRQSGKKTASAEFRALTDLCHVILNSSEFLYVR